LTGLLEGIALTIGVCEVYLRCRIIELTQYEVTNQIHSVVTIRLPQCVVVETFKDMLFLDGGT
jgi:hypothetical protein